MTIHIEVQSASLSCGLKAIFNFSFDVVEHCKVTRVCKFLESVYKKMLTKLKFGNLVRFADFAKFN